MQFDMQAMESRLREIPVEELLEIINGTDDSSYVEEAREVALKIANEMGGIDKIKSDLKAEAENKDKQKKALGLETIAEKETIKLKNLKQGESFTVHYKGTQKEAYEQFIKDKAMYKLHDVSLEKWTLNSGIGMFIYFAVCVITCFINLFVGIGLAVIGIFLTLISGKTGILMVMYEPKETLAPLSTEKDMIVEARPLEKKCPDCAELVKVEAKLCRFCRHQFE